MRQTLNDIADRLAASGLLSVGEIATLLSSISHKQPNSPEQFVQTLVTRGVLTAYQGECILGGRIEHLVLGNYVILDKLGQGGMGLVLKARHRRMDRIVALKMLSPDAIRTPTRAERFQREARAAAKLSHPNIVTAFDADAHHGTHFLVMEYVAGRDLSSLVKAYGPLTVATAIDCILQAAVGLEYAHRNGVVHRDIKPGNLMVCRSAFRRFDDMASSNGGTANVKILDMGLASIENVPGTTVDRELTSTGAVLGTIDYMSPEQALDTKQADARSDIYSLGCTLFYLLTGSTPYPEDTVMRRLLAHRESPIPDLTALRPDVSTTIQGVFQKMMAKNPGQRFQTMTDVIGALTSVRAGYENAYCEAHFSCFPNDSTSGVSGRSTSAISVPPAIPSATVPVTISLPETVLLGTVSTTKATPVANGYSSRSWLISGAVAMFVLAGAAIWFAQSGVPKTVISNQHERDGVTSGGQQPLASLKVEPPIVALDLDLDHDRRVAEWALRGHGHVQLDGQSRQYFAVADLPKQNFKTTYIWVDANSGLNDDRLKDMLSLDSLKRLELNDNHRVTDFGIAHLKGLSSLEYLDLRDTRMTNDGLKYLTELSRLEFLILMGRQFTDEGVGHLEGCTHLRSLHLRCPQMTDKGLSQLQRLLPQLAMLEIVGSQVTDAGLARLAGLPHLEQLGLEALAISDDGLKHLQQLKNLKVLHLSRTPITDPGLTHLRGLTNLEDLALHETKVTAAGVAELQTALPKCAIRF